MSGAIHETCIPLTRNLVPGVRASWTAIERFALTFDGYACLGDGCGGVANAAAERFSSSGAVPTDLRTLRSCLFFEQRRYRHMDAVPTGQDLKYIRALVEAIRDQVPRALF